MFLTRKFLNMANPQPGRAASVSSLFLAAIWTVLLYHLQSSPIVKPNYKIFYHFPWQGMVELGKGGSTPRRSTAWSTLPRTAARRGRRSRSWGDETMPPKHCLRRQKQDVCRMLRFVDLTRLVAKIFQS